MTHLADCVDKQEVQFVPWWEAFREVEIAWGVSEAKDEGQAR